MDRGLVPKRVSIENWKCVNAGDVRHLPFDSHCALSHFATVKGSNRTQVPMRNEGMRPAFACLKIVMCETAKSLESSLAVRA